MSYKHNESVYFQQFCHSSINLMYVFRYQLANIYANLNYYFELYHFLHVPNEVSKIMSWMRKVSSSH